MPCYMPTNIVQVDEGPAQALAVHARLLRWTLYQGERQPCQAVQDQRLSSQDGHVRAMHQHVCTGHAGMLPDGTCNRLRGSRRRLQVLCSWQGDGTHSYRAEAAMPDMVHSWMSALCVGMRACTDTLIS